MDIIRKELGKRLTVKEVASVFGVDARFVRQHYEELGGMRLGDRIYIFFEKEVINAIQRQIKHKDTVDRSSKDQRKEDQTPLPDSQGGHRVGNQRKGADSRWRNSGAGADPHGLLAGVGDSLS